MKRRESGYIGQRMLNMELSGRMKRERKQRRFKDVAKQDIQRAGRTEEDARDRVRWRQVICCGEP